MDPSYLFWIAVSAVQQDERYFIKEGRIFLNNMKKLSVQVADFRFCVLQMLLSEIAAASPDMEMSIFSSCFLKACQKLESERSGWITAANIYEELKGEITTHKPQLLGENPLFPILKGNNGLESKICPKSEATYKNL
ncbi:MAG: hypothetical protein U5K72_11425 [Balneolaceae bacterium]|nr:hypothetical protein [Balneolaceae bacterium]